MDWKLFAATFGLVFLAELGDKTQLAALALSSKTPKPITIFFGAWLALGATTALGVAVGAGLGKLLPERAVTIGTALLFIAVGIFMLVRRA